MNKCLPTREEYYRPRRSRELRIRARRYTQWARRLRNALVQVFVVYGVSIPLAIRFHSAVVLVGVTLTVGLTLPPITWWLDDREKDLRAEARRLDVEHNPALVEGPWY
jgi:hypothetical protein